MTSIINQIKSIRYGKDNGDIIKNSNRHRIVFQEIDGSKTAYYFSVPVYNTTTNRIVSNKFEKLNGRIVYQGSNVRITFQDEVSMESIDGVCKLLFSNKVTSASENYVMLERIELTPSLNGLRVKVRCAKGEKHQLKIKVQHTRITDINHNGKQVSWMLDKFKPLMTVSCIGVSNSRQTIIAPCILNYYIDDCEVLEFSHNNLYGEDILYEVNFYEKKIMQDTTVESLHPSSNNAFGGTSFIGYTDAYGEQWLYSRVDTSKLYDVYDRQIVGAILHIPILSDSVPQLNAYVLPTRFCSFGSAWDNKVESNNCALNINTSHHYYNIDVTPLLVDQYTLFLKSTDGFLLKPKVRKGGFAAIATGDSFYNPQILEIRYK